MAKSVGMLVGALSLAWVFLQIGVGLLNH